MDDAIKRPYRPKMPAEAPEPTASGSTARLITFAHTPAVTFTPANACGPNKPFEDDAELDERRKVDREGYHPSVNEHRGDETPPLTVGGARPVVGAPAHERLGCATWRGPISMTANMIPIAAARPGSRARAAFVRTAHCGKRPPGGRLR